MEFLIQRPIVLLMKSFTCFLFHHRMSDAPHSHIPFYIALLPNIALFLPTSARYGWRAPILLCPELENTVTKADWFRSTHGRNIAVEFRAEVTLHPRDSFEYRTNTTRPSFYRENEYRHETSYSVKTKQKAITNGYSLWIWYWKEMTN